MQDILQNRNGKCTAHAALKIATNLVKEGILTEEEAILSVDPKVLDQLLHPQFDDASLKAAKPLGAGLPASPGAAVGKVYFEAADGLDYVSCSPFRVPMHRWLLRSVLFGISNFLQAT